MSGRVTEGGMEASTYLEVKNLTDVHVHRKRTSLLRGCLALVCEERWALGRCRQLRRLLSRR